MKIDYYLTDNFRNGWWGNVLCFFYTPKNSLELYQANAFADDFEEVKKLMLEGMKIILRKKILNL